MVGSHNKPILTTTPPSLGGEVEPLFQSDKFDKALYANGYKCEIEKVLRCPCANFNQGAAKSSCKNCGGSGWVFVEKTETVLLVSSINRQTKFLNWTEADRGTVSISARPVNRLAFMDRIKLLEVESIFSQIVVLKEYGGFFGGFMYYFPTEVELAYSFVSSDNPLRYMTNGIDFEIQENRLLIKKREALNEGSVISIRYRHNPTYNVIDVNREVIKNKNLDCNGDVRMDDLPISCIARKTHMIFDAPDIFGQGLFDNTNYDQ